MIPGMFMNAVTTFSSCFFFFFLFSFFLSSLFFFLFVFGKGIWKGFTGNVDSLSSLPDNLRRGSGGDLSIIGSKAVEPLRKLTFRIVSQSGGFGVSLVWLEGALL